MLTTEFRTRYPGLSSFTTAQKDLFFGRKQETRELYNLIAVERTVVLFSKSGYGKTSLLQAGVMPLLYGQMLVPVPIRFGTDALRPEQHFSIQFDTAWRKFQGNTEAEAQKQAIDTSTTETFWGQMSRCPFGAAPAQFVPLLIFDQFEELFTLYPDRQQRHRFIDELADLIHENMPGRLRGDILAGLESGAVSDDEAARLEKAPPMRFVFSIRSDMLHFMDELSEQIPYILRSRYQLFGLNEEQATDAIVTPAALTGADFASPPFAYSPAALQQILEVLSKNREVESFQLQAVCQAIEEKMARPAQLSVSIENQLVTPDFYGGRAGIDDILEESYNRRIDSLGEKNADWPLVARRLLEETLVNQNGRRKSVDVADMLGRSGISAALLDELERQRLLRKEPRLDSFYYEISHDTWLAPILKSRKARQAVEELARIEAEKEAAARQRRRALTSSLIAGALILAAVVATIFAFQKMKVARAEAEKAAIALQEVDRQKQLAETAKKGAESADQKALIAQALATEKERAAQLAEEKARTAIAQSGVDSQKARLASEDAVKKRAEANQAKLEARNLTKQAESLLLASKMMAAHKLPDNFDALIPLDSLNCSGWGLGYVSSEIGKLQNLRSLNLRENSLDSLPDEIGKLQRLESLNLWNNQMDYLPATIVNLQNLRWLDIGGNRFYDLSAELLKLRKLPDLTDFSLRISYLSTLPAEIGTLRNLESLNLSNNELNTLPAEINQLQRLQALDLGYNQFSDLPVEIGALQNLQTLNLSYNQFTGLPPIVKQLPNLQTLDLRHNLFTQLPIAELAQLRSLQALNLYDNTLTQQDVDALRAAMPWCVVNWYPN